MRRPSSRRILVLCIASTLLFQPTTPAFADPPLIGKILAPLKRHGTKPVTAKDPAIEILAKNMDWLEHEIDRWGTIVPKTPDVWGEARLTKYRREVEEQLAKKVGQFSPSQINAAQAISDSAFLAAALSMNSRSASFDAASSPPIPTANIAVADSNASPSSGQSGVSSETPAISTATIVINPEAHQPRFSFPLNTANFQLEQVQQLDQLKRYLDHLNELRRINEGDDAADAPGYSLNLLRIPVSVLPGTKSMRGYGAEITFTATPVLSPDLLPRLYKDLVINDLVDQIAVPLTMFLNRDPVEVRKVLRFFQIGEYPNLGVADLNSLLSEIKIPSDVRAAVGLGAESASFVLYDPKSGSFKKIPLIPPDQPLASAKSFLESAMDETAKDLESIRSALEMFIANQNAIEHNAKLLTAGKEDVQRLLKMLKEDVIESDAGQGSSASIAYTDFALVQQRLRSLSNLMADELSPSHLKGTLGPVIQTPVASLVEIASIDAGAIEMNPNGMAKNAKDMKAAKSATYSFLQNKLGDIESGINLMQSELSRNKDSVASTKVAMERIVEILDSIGIAGQSVDALRLTFSDILNSVSLPTSSTRRSTLPYPPRHAPENIGWHGLRHIAIVAHQAFREDLINKEVVHLTDVQAFLREEIHAAYEMLSQPQWAELWSLGTQDSPTLSEAIRLREGTAIEAIRKRFEEQLEPLVSDHSSHVFAWCVFAESMLLNQKLNSEVNSTLGGGVCSPESEIAFYGPNPDEHARAVFAEFVQKRWPLRVFAVDPVTTEQNVTDTSSIYRQMQMAVAMSFASGRTSTSAAMQTLRRIQRDSATIDLNRTAIGFAHGDNTFGWRFQPRFQTPPVQGNATVFFRDLFVGGPTDRQLLRQRELEPGQRECVAIVIIPSFVSDVTIDSRSNWYSLDKPSHSALSNSETVKLSRSIQAMRQNAELCIRSEHLYREGEVQRLMQRVNQLDKELPLQTLNCKLPTEVTLGGFEMLAAGTRELAPELLGWYGSPGYIPGVESSFFLAGDNFSVHETQVIAGNSVLDDKNVRMLSRQIIEVKLSGDLPVIKDPKLNHGDASTYDGYVNIHVGTPYGVSGHLMIPALKSIRKSLQVASPPNVVDTVFTVKAKMNDKGEYNSLGTESFSSPLVKIGLPPNNGLPESLEYKLILSLTTPHGELGQVEFANIPGTNNEVSLTGATVQNALKSDQPLGKALLAYLQWMKTYAPNHELPVDLKVTASLQYGGSGTVVRTTGEATIRIELLDQPKLPAVGTP